MTGQKYIQLLVEEIHSTTIATIGKDGHPQTRIIDLMHYDESGIYFLTAKGKLFYEQLMEQRYVAVSATKDQQAVSLRGAVKPVGKKHLDLIFEKNAYMQRIYPENTREALEVFCIYKASGTFFDIREPSAVVREPISIGETTAEAIGYFVGAGCIGCKLCFSVCPQKCIETRSIPVVIEQNHCLHCGNCAQICPRQVIEKRRYHV